MTSPISSCHPLTYAPVCARRHLQVRRVKRSSETNVGGWFIRAPPFLIEYYEVRSYRK